MRTVGLKELTYQAIQEFLHLALFNYRLLVWQEKQRAHTQAF